MPRITPPFDRLATTLAGQLTLEEMSKLSEDLIYKIVAHPDLTFFINSAEPYIHLDKIKGPYSVYDEELNFLYTMNLHDGSFGAAIVELDFIRKIEDFTIVFVEYTTTDEDSRVIQVIKKA
jgi:hypothetical protein